MKSRTLLSISILAACAVSVHADDKPKAAQGQFVMVTLKEAHRSAETAAKIVRGIGKLTGREMQETRYRIELKKGLAQTEAMRRLRAMPEVAIVQPSLAYEDGPRAMHSRRALQAQIEKLTAERKRDNDGKEEGNDEQEGLTRWKARQYYLEQRAYPNDTIDFAAYYRAVADRDKMSATRFKKGSEISLMATTAKWEFLGPKNLAAASTAMGPAPISGRVNAIAYHPTTPTTFYVGTSSAGMWKTTDNGVTFAPLSDDWQFMNVSSIAVAPNDGNVVYVGTGDWDAWAGYSLGVMKSVDGGNTWTQLGVSNGFNNFAISDILIDPGNANNVTVCMGRGNNANGLVWRSMNAGSTWTTVLNVPAEWSDLCVSPVTGSTRYYYVASSEGNLYRSADRGATWTQVTHPAVAGGFAPMRVACTPASASVVYLLDGNGEDVYKSGNLGATWISVTNNFPSDIGFGPSFTNWAQSWYDSYIAVNVQSGVDIVWVGLIDLNRSSNAGGSWVRAGMTYTGSSKVHPDQHCLTFHPTNVNEGLIGADGGLYRFTYVASTNTFTTTPLNLNLGSIEFYKFDIHPSNADIVIGGTQDNSTPYSKNGDLNNWQDLIGGDGGFAAINPALPNNQYGSTQFLNVYKTEDDWATFSYIGPSMVSETPAFIAPLVLDPNDPNLLYAGSNFLHRYDRSTSTWDNQLGGLAFAGEILAIAVAPGNSDRLYIGTSVGAVWMSTNAGVGWTQINTGSLALPNRAVTDIDVSTSNSSDVLVTLSGTGGGHVYRCSNTLASVVTRQWNNASGGLPDIPANALVRDVDDPANSWHVATDIGVFTTFNAGVNWTNSTGPLGLPNVQCNDLRMRASDRTLYVATYGRGIWRIGLPLNRIAVTGLSLSPNPTTGSSTSTGTVTIASPAGPGGEIVSIDSNHWSALCPSTVTVLEGQTTRTFTINARNNGTANMTAVVSAGRPGSAMSATLTVRPSNYATFVSQAVPGSMIAGQAYYVTVTYNNIGGTTWKESYGHRLVSQNPQNNTTWGLNRLRLLGSATVLPTQNGVFQGTVIAPEAAGTYNFQWRTLQESIAQFGPFSPNLAIPVTVATNAGRMFSQSVPTAVNAGNDFNATVTMRNTGSATWSAAAGYQLVSVYPTDNTVWGRSRVGIAGATTVAPLSNYAFVSSFTAPITAGTYNFHWSMIKVGSGVFGSLTTPIPIVVTNGANNAQFVSQTGVPTTIAAGGTFTANITMKNLGTATWTSGSGHTLQTAAAQNFGVASIVPTGSTATNANQTFTALFTAPATPGTYTFQWRMKAGATPFGQKSTAVTITVT